MATLQELLSLGSLGLAGSSLFKRQRLPNVDIGRAQAELDISGSEPFQAAQGIAQRFRDEAGFGPEFVDRATNPTVQSRLRRFREQTVPTLSSEASKRGLGRSTIATGQIQRAERDTQNDIDQLLSQFFVLNEAQKKTDLGTSAGIETSLLGPLQRQQFARAGLFTDLPLRQAKVQMAGEQQNRQSQAGGATALAGLGPILDKILGTQGQGAALGQFGVQGLSGALKGGQPLAQILQSSNSLDDLDQDSLLALKSLFQQQQGTNLQGLV